MIIFRAFLRQDEGASAIEYALVASLVAIAIAVVVGQIGATLATTFNSVLAAF